MKEIKLTQGQIALVDDDDFEALNQYKWSAKKSGSKFYARRSIIVHGKQITQYMHCEVMKGKGIDHIDINGLNNQKSNLRICTQSENMMNVQKKENCTSVYKGVNFHKPNSKWRAAIKINGKQIHLGYFTSEADAARTYNKKAIELFCEFANLNNVN